MLNGSRRSKNQIRPSKHDQPDRASSVLRRKNNTNAASDVVSNGLAHTLRT